MGIVVIDRLLRAYDDWLNTIASELPQSLIAELDNLEGEVAHDTIDSDLRTPIQKLVVAWSGTPGVVAGDLAASVPHDVWRALDAIEDAYADWHRSRLPKIESIAELTEQRVPDRQICRIYGFLCPDGTEDLKRLEDERANPGKHTGNGWMAPIAKQRLEAAAAGSLSSADRRERREKLLSPKVSAKPSDLKELVEQGVSGRQIARMLGVDHSELAGLCEEAGLETPPFDYRSNQSQRGAFEPELLEAAGRAIDADVARPTRGRSRSGSESATAAVAGAVADDDTDGDAIDLEAAAEAARDDGRRTSELLGQVIKLTAEGLEPGRIARQLRREGHSITAADVRGMVG